MIGTCRHCHQYYWRYRRDHPPKGFCSLPHFEAGPKKATSSPAPLKPDVLISEWRSHRIADHGDSHFLQDFECDTCDYYEDRYAESLGYWLEHPVVSPDRIAGPKGAGA
jgi:hypothetical protein